LRGFLISLLLTALTATATAHPRQTPGVLKLGAVNVVGAKRYTSEDVTKAAGLTVGQPITIEALTQAADRLGQSGLFKTLAFRYVTKGDVLSVTFEFEEADPTLTVTFDNFVWFTDAEVRAAVRDAVPAFDGVVPPGEGLPDVISGALQALLTRRRIPGRIHFSPQADYVKGNVLGYVFSVRDPAPQVCALRIEGATAIPEEQLVQAVSMAGKDFSRIYADSSAKGTLRDRYRQLGYWAAEFAPANVAVDAGCSGVTVTLKVTEGVQYAWDHPDWSGNAVLTADQLTTLMTLKAGETASMLKIEEGLRAVKRAYGKKGYIAAGASYSSRLDAASRKAVFHIHVTEGPQFRFGNVEFAGFSDADGVALKKKWQLASGDVFDDSYPTTFFTEVLRPALQRIGGGRQVASEVRADEAKRIIDVRFVLK
jgi:outer membrane protein assembly factor BamA